jgi:hypothetical protein
MGLIAVISLMRIQVFMLALLLDVKKAHRLMWAFLRVSRILCKRRLITAEAFFPQTE